MANVTRESIGKLHDKITVKISKEDYYPSFEKSLKNYAKTANVPGFRKGMVPGGMLKKMYGQSLFTDEVLRSASRKLEEYMQQEKLAIFAQPMALPADSNLKIDMNAPADMDFYFEVGLKPDFEVTPLKNKTTLTRYKVEAGEKMIADEIDRIQRRYGKVENPEDITAKDDIVYSTISASDAAEDAEKLEDTSAMDKLPAKLQDMLMGKKIGDVVTFVPAEIAEGAELEAFMKDPLKTEAENAGKQYTMTITKVSHVIPRELDETLFAEVFQNEEVKTEEEFRARIKAELGREYDRITRDRLNNEMYELLVHQTPIELPVTFLKRWMKEGGDKPKSEREVEQEFPQFDHQLRWTLVSDKLIIDNNINVSEEDIKNEIKSQVMRYFGMPADEAEPEWMDSYMQKIQKDEKTMNETYRRLLYDKLFDWLQTQFNIEEKAVTEEEFFKLQDAHSAHHHH